MSYKKWMGVLLISLAALLPFVTTAQQSQRYGKRQANGTVVCECIGLPNCKCDPNWRPPEERRIAECGFSRPIRIATLSNNRPFGWAEWVRSNGSNYLTSKGFGVDVFEQLAKKLKLRYQVFGYESDQQAINELKKGNLDLLIGIYSPGLTIGRGATVIFPALFANVFTVYYTKENAFEVRNYNSLRNKVGMIRRAENIYSIFAQHISDDMQITLETTEDAFKKLMLGEADYLIGSPYSIEAELRRYKLHNDIISSGTKIFDATMFMVLTRATDCFKLKELLGKALEEYNADPSVADKQIRTIIDDWGERFRGDSAMKVSQDEGKSSDTEEN